MSEPAKGPWRWENRLEVSETGSGADCLTTPEYEDRRWPPQQDIVLFPSYEDSAIEWVNEADARLIEKAPEMLALLRWVSYERIPAKDVPSIVAQVDEIIAYILGETP